MGKSGRMMIREAWTEVEDKQLKAYVKTHGPRKWGHVSRHTGIKRSGKSCRLRWLNYLRPGIKKGDMSPEEEELIIRLHNLVGNRWSLIAGRLPGRSDNEIKNYWNTTLAKRRHPPPLISSPENIKEKEESLLPPPPAPAPAPLPPPPPDTELPPPDDHPIDDEAYNYSSLLPPYHPAEIMNLSGNYLFRDEDNDDGLLYLQGFDDDDGIWGSGNTTSSSTGGAGAPPNALWSDFFT